MLKLYTETAFRAVPPTPSSLLDFQIPRRNGAYHKSKYSPLSTTSPAKDEKLFAQQHLASVGEFHFRQAKSYPRTFLWKVVADRVLQVQCADISRSVGDTREAYLTLSFTFQDAILPAGVSFTDSDTENEIHIFVCTVRNEAFHLRIPTNAFRGPEAISQDVGQWCTPMDISSLAIETVFRIYASTPFELFISYTSGKLQRLQRKANGDHWTPENYDDKTWGASLRGIVGRGRLQGIEHGSIQLDPRVVQGMVASSDSNYLFTICLNHQLRVWHLATGKLAVMKDLLDIAREPHDRTQLNPSENGFLQLFKLPVHKYPILVTYSPHESGQFKFWDVKGGLTESLSLEDRFPRIKLSPPDPDPSGNTVWSMTDFKLSPGSDFRPAQLWVLWRNNNYHQVYTNHFEFGEIDRTWNESWVMCSTDATKKTSSPNLVKSDARDVTSKWLDFLFRPGVYPSTVLETALSIYQEVVSARLTPSQKSSGLKQRLCTVIAAMTILRKYDESDMDYERFAADTDHQWRNYWRIVENLNDGRRAPISLSYDLFSEVAWVVMTDMCCVVRECSQIELILQNEPTDLAVLGEVAGGRWSHRKVSDGNIFSFQQKAQLITAARAFRRSFPAELVIDLATAIEEEILTNPETTTPTRVYEIYDRVNFGDAVSNEAFHKLEKDLESVSPLHELRNELFSEIVSLLSGLPGAKPASRLRSTMFGLELLSAGQLDCIITTRQLLRDLLVLIIFIEGELNQEDDKMDAFDGAELLEEIAPILKTQERNFWLATHFRLTLLEFLGNDTRTSGVRDGKELIVEQSRTVSLLEDILSKAVQPHPIVDKPLMYHITDALQELQDWTSGKNEIALDEASVYLQCDLLRHHEYDLATEFLRFQPATSWSTYTKGRLYLAKINPELAAQYFRKAAYGLACGKAFGELHGLSAGLLSRLEIESFNNGLPRYFQHVMTLFESSKAFAQTAQFARLALQSLTPGQKDPIYNFRSELLSRLFTAELQSSRYEAAFEALIQFSDQALQKSDAISLFKAMLDPKISTSSMACTVTALQSLPWALYPNLAKQLDQQLSLLAKKQKTIATDPKQWVAADGSLDYLKIAHVMRMSQQDHRGAVSILFDRLRLIQRSGKMRNDPQATAIRNALLALINAMTCVAPDEAYILAEAEQEPSTVNGTDGQRESDIGLGRKRRRIIITLADLRKEYQEVLDKCSRIERGDFDFDVDSESDGDDYEEDIDRSRLRGMGRSGDAMEF